jgi:Cu-Zn family superoxide dismutase
MTHGSPWATIRHVGDLGKIIANDAGVAEFMFMDWLISLHENVINSIIGRGMTLHMGELLFFISKFIT